MEVDVFALTADDVIYKNQTNYAHYVFDYYHMIDGPEYRHMGQTPTVKFLWRDMFLKSDSMKGVFDVLDNSGPDFLPFREVV